MQTWLDYSEVYIFKLYHLSINNYNYLSLINPTLSFPVLDASNAVYLLTKHKFPPAKWRNLAAGLKQISAIQSIEADSANVLSQLVALIVHWVANDKEKSWKKLVDAVHMSEESVIAEKLAWELGVPSPGTASSTKQPCYNYDQ